MIVDGLHHLDGAGELGVGVKGDQGAPLVANIRPLTRCACGVVEGVLQVVVPLAPHQTQVLLLALIVPRVVLIAVQVRR